MGAFGSLNAIAYKVECLSDMILFGIPDQGSWTSASSNRSVAIDFVAEYCRRKRSIQ